MAGSAGQINGNNTNTYPLFYTRNEANSNGGESGALYLEIQDNRLDAKFVGNSGTIRDRFTIMKGTNKKTIVNTVINKPAVLNASWIGGYNWYTGPDATSKILGQSRTFSITPSTTGNFTYYVSDSLSPEKTCVADTFTLKVTSTMAVSVTKFDAVVKNKKTLVQWTTAQEINSDYFTVERSANGRDFEMMMVIDGKGNTDLPTRYEFIDNTLLHGTIYYRLTATDKNADKEIVGTITIANQPDKLDAVQTVDDPPANKISR